VLKNGGKLLGKVRHPLNTQEFLVLPAAGAGVEGEIVGLANAGATRRTRSSRRRIGIVKGGQNLAGLLRVPDRHHALGLPTAQG